jgi:hypothetical protein
MYSKTDQYGTGAIRKINRADLKIICAVNNIEGVPVKGADPQMGHCSLT